MNSSSIPALNHYVRLVLNNNLYHAFKMLNIPKVLDLINRNLSLGAYQAINNQCLGLNGFPLIPMRSPMLREVIK